MSSHHEAPERFSQPSVGHRTYGTILVVVSIFLAGVAWRNVFRTAAPNATIPPTISSTMPPWPERPPGPKPATSPKPALRSEAGPMSGPAPTPERALAPEPKAMPAPTSGPIAKNLPDSRPNDLRQALPHVAHTFDPTLDSGVGLRVTITSVTPGGGEVSVALFAATDNFPNAERARHAIRVDGSSDTVTATFAGLPTGKYAVAVYQDRDGNDQLNRGGFGIPNEPYGFSNNARGRFGPPSFSAASFDLDFERDNAITIELK